MVAVHEVFDTASRPKRHPPVHARKKQTQGRPLVCSCQAIIQACCSPQYRCTQLSLETNHLISIRTLCLVVTAAGFSYQVDQTANKARGLPVHPSWMPPVPCTIAALGCPNSGVGGTWEGRRNTSLPNRKMHVYAAINHIQTNATDPLHCVTFTFRTVPLPSASSNC